MSTFLDEFTLYLDATTIASGQLIIVGDFNLHYESATSQQSQKFRILLSSTNMKQSVMEPTHDKGHILDLVITREQNEDLIQNIHVQPFPLSDHSCIFWDLQKTKYCQDNHQNQKAEKH